MVATFILTRTFAVCAFLVGAIPLTYGAPINADASIQNIDERNCRILGCLRVAIPNHEAVDADSDLLPVASGRDDDISESSSAAVGEVIKHVRPRVEDTSFSEMATTADPSYAVARESDADYAKLLPEIDSLEK